MMEQKIRLEIFALFFIYFKDRLIIPISQTSRYIKRRNPEMLIYYRIDMETQLTRDHILSIITCITIVADL